MLHNAAASSNPPARGRGGWRRVAAPGGGLRELRVRPVATRLPAMSTCWIDVALVRLATCATAEFGRPQHHRDLTARVVPPPRCLAARGIDPPRQRAGGWSPRCRRSETRTAVCDSPTFQGEGKRHHCANNIPMRWPRNPGSGRAARGVKPSAHGNACTSGPSRTGRDRCGRPCLSLPDRRRRAGPSVRLGR